MGFDAQIITPQLLRLSVEQLDHLRSQWADAPEMCRLIDAEKAARPPATGKPAPALHAGAGAGAPS